MIRTNPFKDRLLIIFYFLRENIEGDHTGDTYSRIETISERYNNFFRRLAIENRMFRRKKLKTLVRLANICQHDVSNLDCSRP